MGTGGIGDGMGDVLHAHFEPRHTTYHYVASRNNLIDQMNYRPQLSTGLQRKSTHPAKENIGHLLHSFLVASAQCMGRPIPIKHNSADKNHTKQNYLVV
jgi:hypothetical protein